MRAVGAVLVVVLTACTLIPLVPEPLERAPRLDLSGSPGIRLVAGGLELAVRLTEVPGTGSLVARWFDPDGVAILESVLEVTLGDTGRTLYFTGPSNPRPGRWRAVVMLDGVVARQFATQVDPP